MSRLNAQEKWAPMKPQGKRKSQGKGNLKVKGPLVMEFDIFIIGTTKIASLSFATSPTG